MLEVAAPQPLASVVGEIRQSTVPTRVEVLIAGWYFGSNRPIGVAVDSSHAVALGNDDALQWLYRKGWGVQVAETTVRAHMDFIETQKFSLGRNWQTATSVAPDADSYNPDLVYVTFLLRGHLFLQAAGGQPRKVAAPFFYTHSARLPVGASAPEPYSCLFIGIPRERLAALSWVEGQAPGPFVTTSAFRRILIASLNASLDSQIQERQVGFHSWRRGVEDLLLAALTATSVQQDGITESDRDVRLARAYLLIEENFRDPTFSTQVLARTLNISLSQLHRVFAGESRTVGATIRGMRTDQARILLRDSENSKPERHRIAQESGFRSLRTMRRLLKEDLAEGTSDGA